MIEENIKIEEKNCIVTYDANGGMGNMESQSVRKGSIIAISDNNFIREGYNFIGWSKDKNATIDSELYTSGNEIQIDEDITLFAIWKNKIYKWEKYKITRKITYSYKESGGYSQRWPSGTYSIYSDFSFSETEGFKLSNKIGDYTVDKSADLTKYINGYTFLSNTGELWKVQEIDNSRLRFGRIATQTKTTNTIEENLGIIESTNRNEYEENKIYIEDSIEYKYKFKGSD